MYDAIVVGARCAGAPTAMLLARARPPGPAAGPRHVPQRHALDPLHPPVRRRPARPLGPARPARGDRLPADPPLHVRRRPVRADRLAAADRRRRRRLLPAPLRARHACSPTRPRRRAPRSAQGVTVRGAADGRRAASTGVRGRAAAGDVRERAIVIGADGRNSVVARAAGRRRYDERPRHADLRLLHVLGRRRDGRRRALPAPRPHDRRLPHPRRPRGHDRALAAGRVRGRARRTSRAPSRGASRSPRASPSALRAGTRAEPLPRHRACSPTTSAPPPARAGRSPATPATTRTRSWRSGIGDAFRDADLLADGDRGRGRPRTRYGSAPRRARRARLREHASRSPPCEPPSRRAAGAVRACCAATRR